MHNSKSYADFAMQNHFKARSTHPDLSWSQFIEHFTWKDRCRAKSILTYNENLQLSKCAEWQTEYLGEISAFKGKCAVNTVNFICNLLTGPLI